MSENIQIERDSQKYWDLGNAFSEVVIDELNDALKENGILDAELRQQICSRFGFGFGNFLDQYWFEHESKKYYPLIAFTEEFLNTGTPISEVEPLHLKSEDFEFHGAMDEAATVYFEENNQEATVRVGYVGEE